MEQNKKRKLPAWAIVLIVLGVIGVLGAFASLNEENTEIDNSKKTTKTVESKELTLEEDWTSGKDDTGYFYYVEGYVNNPTDKNYDYVQITFTSYDSDGNTLGTCIDNNSGLEKGGRWKFKAACLENIDNIASVKFKEITKW